MIHESSGSFSSQQENVEPLGMSGNGCVADLAGLIRTPSPNEPYAFFFRPYEIPPVILKFQYVLNFLYIFLKCNLTRIRN